MEDKRRRCKTICPVCKDEFEVAQSIMMSMGMNSGSCTCPECKTHLHLEIDVEKYEKEIYEMKAEDYKIYAERMREKHGRESKI